MEQTQSNLEPGATRGLRHRFERLLDYFFSVDLRSLAALRIGLAVMILFDLGTRALHLEAHYADSGAAPTALMLAKFGKSAYFSIHYWLSAKAGVGAVTALFVIHGLLALALLAGYRTRIVTILCWYMAASLLVRNPILHTVGDRVMQVTLFWSMFLPLGARWSVDRALSRERPDSNSLASMASFALLMQICFVYWFSGFLKLLSPIWQDGEAVAFALSLDSYANAIGVWFREFESILTLLTLLVLAWELLGPCLAFVPGFIAPGRMIAVIGFILMHLSFALFMNLGVFPYMNAVIWLVFIPGEFWNWAGRRPRLVAFGERVRDKVAGVNLPALLRPRPVRVQPYLAESLAVTALFGVILVLNIRSLHPVFRKVIPSAFVKGAYALRLRQNWGMFTRGENQLNGWLVIPGELADGRTIDLLTGEDVSWDLPTVPSEKYGTARWTQFLNPPGDPREVRFWGPYGDYVCRKWNERHDGPDRLVRMEMFYMLRKSLLFGADEKIFKVWLHDQCCGQIEPSESDP